MATTSEISIRPGTPRDLDACFALDEALNESRPAAEQEGFLISGDRRASYDGYQALGCFYVAEAGGQIIGFAFALPPGSEHFEAIRSQKAGFQMDRPEVWEISDLSWMGKVAVRPDWMRRGVARRLYETIFQARPSWSFLTMTVDRPVTNTPAEKLHEALEFETVGKAPLGDRGALRNVFCKVHFRPAH